MSNNIVENNNNKVPEKSKRGRKKKIVSEDNNITSHEQINEPIKPPPKKRGRKPKGGKIISQNINVNNKCDNEPNIILHLKCFLKDITHQNNENNKLKYNPVFEKVEGFNFHDNNKNNNELLINSEHSNKPYQNINDKFHDNDDDIDNDIHNDNDNVKSIWKKINTLKINLHKNNISDKRSACFWCTYEFDNPPIYIPKCSFKDTYQVYGCFCSPQCGVAHLMNEKIDASIKFERYQLLNHVYGKIYNYSKTIKPAPDPYYLLDKYYGNLSIKEYRELFNNDQLLIVVEKPLSHVFPELYEDNSDFILNKKTIPSNSSFKLKRKTDPVKKTSILDNLGINKN